MLDGQPQSAPPEGRDAPARPRSALGPGHDPLRARAAAVSGDALLGQDKLEEALARYMEAARLDSTVPDYPFNAGLILWQLRRDQQALTFLEKTIQLNPKFGRAHIVLGQLFKRMGKLDLAHEHARIGYELEPDDLRGAIGYASLLDFDRETETAYEIIKPFLENGQCHSDLALLVGRIALARDGMDALALDMLSRALADPAPRTEREIRSLHFMLASLLDRAGDYDLAFTHARQGNALRKASYDPKEHERLIGQTIESMSPRRLATMPRSTCDTKTPVFIVGMVRSGTTLVEQILSSHPQIHGAGELTWFFELARSIIDAPGQENRLASMSLDAVNDVARKYLDPLQALNPSALRITDKLPANYMYLGLISILFPQARIIHCRRDPMDNCVSCFMTNFASANDFSFDLRWLGHYYRQYERLMAHWKSVLEIPMLDVQYEQVVEDLPGQARRLVEFVGLPWDDACLNFQDNKRHIHTASNKQVRRPIYKTSVARWHHYEKHLAPLMAALGWG